MRIRKNKKLTASEIVGSSSIPPETIQAHVCLLNRSPWDLFLVSPNQDDSFGDSIEAADSESMKLSSEEKLITKEDGDDNDDDGGRHSRTFGSSNGDTGVLISNNNNGKEWRCRQAISDRYYLCDKNQPPFIPLSAAKPVIATGAIAAAPKKRGRPRKYPVSTPPPQQAPSEALVVAASSSTNRYEFCYYTGFGPHWGKQRSGDSKEEADTPDSKDGWSGNGGSGNDGLGKRSWSLDREDSKIYVSDHKDFLFEDLEELDYIGDENDDDADGDGGGGNDNDNAGRRRGRKPIKARSLKSLM